LATVKGILILALTYMTALSIQHVKRLTGCSEAHEQLQPGALCDCIHDSYGLTAEIRPGSTRWEPITWLL